MPIAIEFCKKGLTQNEADARWKEGSISTREKPQLLSSGKIGLFIAHAVMPDFALLEDPKIPADLLPRYIYRGRIFDQGRCHEGQYPEQGIEYMSVQHDRDRDCGEKFSRVVIAGRDLHVIARVYTQLRDGVLRPMKEWSSPGQIAAPVAALANDTKEDSGQLTFPRMAAERTKAA